jgi:cell division protein YceG involved in septum cleavage
VLVALFFVCSASLGFLVVETKRLLQEQFISYTAPSSEAVVVDRVFPVGVDPRTKVIIENPDVDPYFDQHFSLFVKQERQLSWFPKLLGKLALFDWYQNLASLSSRILVIQPGERKEQIADHFGKILGWTDSEKTEFLEAILDTHPVLDEGKFPPGTYTVAKGATPSDVVPLVKSRFEEDVLSRYAEQVDSVVPLNDALTIASLLQREAYDFTDMRQISGVIWNRLFVDMRLQIDATLQYAKGSDPNQPWWPQVRPSDKHITSVYNTYKNEGLPPAPIANPSLDAILAALNPKKTDCMYYFHDKEGGFHCTKTYEEHVALLKQYYGRGK